MNICFIISARYGSKSLIGKNYREVNNIPLFRRTLSFVKLIAPQSKCFFLSNDDQIQLNDSELSFCNILHRPIELDRDNSKGIDVINYVSRNVDFKHYDIVFYLQPTSPFRSFKTFSRIIKMFKNKKEIIMAATVNYIDSEILKSLIEVNGEFFPVNKISYLSYNRQNLPKVAKINGNMFAFRGSSMTGDWNFLPFDKCGFINVRNKEAIDINSFFDLKFANTFNDEI